MISIKSLLKNISLNKTGIRHLLVGLYHSPYFKYVAILIRLLILRLSFLYWFNRDLNLLVKSLIEYASSYIIADIFMKLLRVNIHLLAVNRSTATVNLMVKYVVFNNFAVFEMVLANLVSFIFKALLGGSLSLWSNILVILLYAFVRNDYYRHLFLRVFNSKDMVVYMIGSAKLSSIFVFLLFLLYSSWLNYGREIVKHRHSSNIVTFIQNQIIDADYEAYSIYTREKMREWRESSISESNVYVPLTLFHNRTNRYDNSLISLNIFDIYENWLKPLTHKGSFKFYVLNSNVLFLAFLENLIFWSLNNKSLISKRLLKTFLEWLSLTFLNQFEDTDLNKLFNSFSDYIESLGSEFKKDLEIYADFKVPLYRFGSTWYQDDFLLFKKYQGIETDITTMKTMDKEGNSKYQINIFNGNHEITRKILVVLSRFYLENKLKVKSDKDLIDQFLINYLKYNASRLGTWRLQIDHKFNLENIMKLSNIFDTEQLYERDYQDLSWTIIDILETSIRIFINNLISRPNLKGVFSSRDQDIVSGYFFNLKDTDLESYSDESYEGNFEELLDRILNNTESLKTEDLYSHGFSITSFYNDIIKLFVKFSSEIKSCLKRQRDENYLYNFDYPTSDLQFNLIGSDSIPEDKEIDSFSHLGLIINLDEDTHKVDSFNLIRLAYQRVFFSLVDKKYVNNYYFDNDTYSMLNSMASSKTQDQGIYSKTKEVQPEIYEPSVPNIETVIFDKLKNNDFKRYFPLHWMEKLEDSAYQDFFINAERVDIQTGFPITPSPARDIVNNSPSAIMMHVLLKDGHLNNFIVDIKDSGLFTLWDRKGYAAFSSDFGTGGAGLSLIPVEVFEAIMDTIPMEIIMFFDNGLNEDFSLLAPNINRRFNLDGERGADSKVFNFLNMSDQSTPKAVLISRFRFQRFLNSYKSMDEFSSDMLELTHLGIEDLNPSELNNLINILVEYDSKSNISLETELGASYLSSRLKAKHIVGASRILSRFLNKCSWLYGDEFESLDKDPRFQIENDIWFNQDVRRDFLENIFKFLSRIKEWKDEDILSLSVYLYRVYSIVKRLSSNFRKNAWVHEKEGDAFRYNFMRFINLNDDEPLRNILEQNKSISLLIWDRLVSRHLSQYNGELGLTTKHPLPYQPIIRFALKEVKGYQSCYFLQYTMTEGLDRISSPQLLKFGVNSDHLKVRDQDNQYIPIHLIAEKQVDKKVWPFLQKFINHELSQWTQHLGYTGDQLPENLLKYREINFREQIRTIVDFFFSSCNPDIDYQSTIDIQDKENEFKTILSQKSDTRNILRYNMNILDSWKVNKMIEVYSDRNPLSRTTTGFQRDLLEVIKTIGFTEFNLENTLSRILSHPDLMQMPNELLHYLRVLDPDNNTTPLLGDSSVKWELIAEENAASSLNFLAPTFHEGSILKDGILFHSDKYYTYPIDTEPFHPYFEPPSSGLDHDLPEDEELSWFRYSNAFQIDERLAPFTREVGEAPGPRDKVVDIRNAKHFIPPYTITWFIVNDYEAETISNMDLILNRMLNSWNKQAIDYVYEQVNSYNDDDSVLYKMRMSAELEKNPSWITSRRGELSPDWMKAKLAKFWLLFGNFSNSSYGRFEGENRFLKKLDPVNIVDFLKTWDRGVKRFFTFKKNKDIVLECRTDESLPSRGPSFYKHSKRFNELGGYDPIETIHLPVSQVELVDEKDLKEGIESLIASKFNNENNEDDIENNEDQTCSTGVFIYGTPSDLWKFRSRMKSNDFKNQYERYRTIKLIKTLSCTAYVSKKPLKAGASLSGLFIPE